MVRIYPQTENFPIVYYIIYITELIISFIYSFPSHVEITIILFDIKQI